MKLKLVACALVSSFFLSGCVISVGGDGDSHYSSDWQDREVNNRKHISQLDSGMSYESVVRKMGVADFNELHQNDDNVIRVLFYRTRRTVEDGITTKEECTPLVFRNGELVGWGESAYAKI